MGKTLFCVYFLKDPRSGIIRYIGITNSISRRCYQHNWYAKNNRRNHYVYNWIRELLELKLNFSVGVLEDSLTQEKAFEREIHWIETLKDKNDLTNLDGGGKGFGVNNIIWKGRKHTVETKKKISEGNKGKKHSINRKIKISESKKKYFGDKKYKSKNNRGEKSKKVKVLDAITGELLHEFSSILECSKVLNLNRYKIKESFTFNKIYIKYKFQIT